MYFHTSRAGGTILTCQQSSCTDRLFAVSSPIRNRAKPLKYAAKPPKHRSRTAPNRPQNPTSRKSLTRSPASATSLKNPVHKTTQNYSSHTPQSHTLPFGVFPTRRPIPSIQNVTSHPFPTSPHGPRHPPNHTNIFAPPRPRISYRR